MKLSRNVIIALVVVLILVVFGFIYAANRGDNTVTPSPTPSAEVTTPAATTSPAS